MRQFLRYFTILTLVFLCGCSTVPQGEEFVIPKDKGAVILKLAAAKVKTRATTATDFVHPSADEFNITFVSEAMDTVFQKPFTEFPYALVLPAGNYKALAEYGKNVPFSLDMPYYRSEQLFVVEMGQTTDIDMKAVLHSFIVQINYSADFADYFTTFSVVGEVEGGDTYTFAADASGSAYFAPCTLRLVLKGVLKDGAPYSSIIQEFSSTGTELHKLNIRVLPRGHSFDVDIDRSVTLVDITSTVPDEFLPDMPAILPLEISTYETESIGDGVNTVLSLSSILKITDVCFAPDANLKSAFGITPDTLRASVAGDVAILGSMGVDVSGLIGSQHGAVDFKVLAQQLLTQGGVATNFTMGVKTVDYFNKSAAGDVTFTVNPPVFNVADIVEGSVWSSSLDPLPTVNVEHGGSGLNYKYQLSADNISWIDISGSEIKSLNPSTTYYVRAVYRDYATASKSFTTETPAQVVNAGMEDWKIDEVNGNYHHYKPWTGNTPEWWNTSNSRCFTYYVWGSVTQYNNPTSVCYTTSAKSGSKASEIRSVRIAVSGRRNVCGKLIIGTLTSGGTNGLLSGNNNPEYLTEGRPFGARPTKLQFWYKYNKYGTDNYVITVRLRNGETVIAESVVTGSESNSEYKQMEIEIPYSKPELAATSLYICFASSKDDNFENRTISVSYPGGWSSGWKADVGSILNIDDIELIYEK